MDAIIAAIVTGLFSLTGIWYQNYLSRRSARTPEGNINTAASGYAKNHEQLAQPRRKKDYKTIRIIFTILIAAVPIPFFNYWLRFVDKYTIIHRSTSQALRHNIITVRNEIILYCAVWIIITIAALFISWKTKTLFEKIILVISVICIFGAGLIGFVRYELLLQQRNAAATVLPYGLHAN